MEHAIRNEIHVKLEEDPAFYTSLRERLEKLVEDGKAKRIDAAQQLKLFEQIRQEMRGRDEAAQGHGLSETAFAIYGLITPPATEPLEAADSVGGLDGGKKELSTLIEEQLESQVSIVDWVHKDDVQREMRRLIKRQLRAANISAEKIDATAESIVELMKRRRGRG
jgi:type I restriction enzyme R subunit